MNRPVLQISPRKDVPMKLLGLGDNVCDLYLHTGMMYPGGQALNVAVNAARLGAKADFLGVFGTDCVAEHVRHVLDEEGIGCERCRIYPGENGYAKVTLNHGDRVFLGSNRGGVLQRHPISLDEEDLSYCSEFQIIHTSNNSFLDGELPKLSTLPGLVSYDFSGQWTDEERLNRVCPYIDFAFLSGSGLSETEAIAIANRMMALGKMVVCITRGNQSALIYNGPFHMKQSPYIVEALDTMGAGDSFAAGLLTKLGKQLEQDGKENWGNPLYRAELLHASLVDAAKWSAHTCTISGAIGYGTDIPLELMARVST